MASGMRVYISGPLTAASDLASARRYYDRLAALCRDQGLTPYLPHTENDPELHASASPAEVFRADLRQLLASDLVVAYVGSPSLGVGAELALAVRSQIPIVAVRRPDEVVSRFVVGMLESAGGRIVVASDNELSRKMPDALRGTIALLNSAGYATPPPATPGASSA